MLPLIQDQQGAGGPGRTRTSDQVIMSQLIASQEDQTCRRRVLLLETDLVLLPQLLPQKRIVYVRYGCSIKFCLQTKAEMVGPEGFEPSSR